MILLYVESVVSLKCSCQQDLGSGLRGFGDSLKEIIYLMLPYFLFSYYLDLELCLKDHADSLKGITKIQLLCHQFSCYLDL
jgi:hypothetical protein